MKPNPYEDANGNLVDMPVHPLDCPYLTLADAITLLVQDDPHLAPSIKPFGTTDSDNIAAANRRAAKKLFEAAQSGEVKLFSYQAGDGYVAVPKDYFEIQRTIGDTACTIETDLNAAPMEAFIAAREGKERKFLYVTVETASFVDWRKGELAGGRISLASAELKCKRWLINEMQGSPLRRPMSKDTYWDKANSQFNGLGRRGFNRAWANAVESTGSKVWTFSGRPRKSNHRTN